MTKAKKIKAVKLPRGQSLIDQIQNENRIEKSRVKFVKNEDGKFCSDDEEIQQSSSSNNNMLSSKTTHKILKQARDQIVEEDETFDDSDNEMSDNSCDVDDEEEIDDVEETLKSLSHSHTSSIEAKLRIAESDQLAFDTFRTAHVSETTAKKTGNNLSSLIQGMVNEKKTEIDSQCSEFGVNIVKQQNGQSSDVDPQVRAMFEGVGQVLAKYRSGKVPKAFKMVAHFKNWEELLLLTRPEQWSAASMLVAVKIFSSALKESLAQRFFNQVLLPRIRDDIDSYSRLNVHLYQALRKAMFKPGAFFKGLLLPLCQSKSCTLKEAIIIGSVLAKNSIPILHACAGMVKIAEMEYSGANSIFLRILLDKKFALPFRVVDSLVHHICQFRNEKRSLPVLWHQMFLTFSQRYKNHLSSEQRDALLEICKIHSHLKITPDIRRELINAECRDAIIVDDVENIS